MEHPRGKQATATTRRRSLSEDTRLRTDYPTPRAIVFGDHDLVLTTRTLRALRRAGFDAVDLTRSSHTELAAEVAARAPVWLVRAAAWPVTEGVIAPPPPSATGLPLCALGWVQDDPAWSDVHARTGGDLSRLRLKNGVLPPIASVWMEHAPARACASHLAREGHVEAALDHVARAGDYRVVRVASLDVHTGDELRIVQAITSLQQGGAEKVALELTSELRARNIVVLPVGLGHPTRAAFDPPAGFVDLSEHGDRAERISALGREALLFGADVVHAHLLDAADLRQLSSLGIPVVATVHNARAGWPEGLDGIGTEDAALLIACSQAVEADLRAAAIPIAMRTIWNGISPPSSPGPRTWRTRLGVGADDLMLLAVANPRPQKRLHLLPAIATALRHRLRCSGEARAVHLVVAGGASRVSEAAAACREALDAAVDAHGMKPRAHLLGSTDDVCGLLRESDVLVSPSAYEGLSLAHLEALSVGLPVVATDVGGAREIAGAGDKTAFSCVPVDASPEVYADAIAAALERRVPASLPEDFTAGRMGQRHADLYRRVATPRRVGRGLLLVTNNFSTGGAQSSARRLLLGLASEAVRVRAAVLQEHPDHPTPGSVALEAGGVPVTRLPPVGSVDAEVTVAALLRDIDADPPEAVLLWNAIPEHKILLADALLSTPVYDVSPGEMYFASLERYFARPRPGLPYRTARDYGLRLAGVIVKYAGEAALAAELLGAKVSVIPNGVPLGEARGSKDARGVFTIGTTARIAPQKRLEDLLDALRIAGPRLPPHVLCIAGAPELGSEAYAAELRERARDLPVRWVGERDASAFLRDLDLFATISEPAGCPNASLEALAVGLPIVATDVGGASEQIEDGVTGRLVPQRDPNALAAALVDLAHDESTRDALGRSARTRAADRFSMGAMIAAYRGLCLPTYGVAPTDRYPR